MQNQIPKNWQKVKLNNLGFVGRGKSKHRPRNDSSLYGGEYPFIQTSDVKNTNLYITDYSQTYNHKGLSQSKLWDPGTLLITIAANIAETAILKIPACFPDSIVGFIANPKKSDTRFVKYYIDTIKLNMQSVSKGTTQDNLSLDKLLTFNFYIPEEVDDQKGIANILSAFDDLIENNNKQIKILEEMAQAIYKEWFVHFRFPGHEKVKMVDSPLGKIPERWPVVKVEDLVGRISSGNQYDNKTVKANGLVPVLDQGKSGIIGYHDDEPGVNASEDNPIIVFANHTCYQRLIHFSFSAIQNVLPFIPNKANFRNIYWLYYATKDLVKFNDYKGHWPEFMSKKLLLPEDYICEEFGTIIKPIEILIFKLEKENTKLRQTRDLLLPKLMSGKLRVN